ncbi:hypothetical protein ABES03_24165 [Neobacillus rhizosphaerae]|uniref:hypothetical protein n=1 Tax=Neobacillus rhizosphaerae TaxID=2880965 RepID=UPI003D2B7892
MGLEKFSAALDLLKGFHVNLFVGENVYKGKLIGVETDHVVLETENKYIFYYNIDKIQAITKNTKQFKADLSSVSFQKTQSLKELLHSFQNTWVTILAFNKQKFTGVLSDIDEDFVTVINGEERILIKVEHVSNILKGVIKEEESKQEDAKETKNSSDKANKSDDDKIEESKEDKDCHSYQEKEDKSKQKTKSFSNKGSESKSKVADKKHEEMDIEEKVIWSQPIKVESVVTQTKEVVHKNKKNHSEEMTPKMVVEIKKPQNETCHNDKKNEEPKTIKPNGDESLKDLKPEMESAPLFKMEPKPAPLLSMPKKEVKTIKTHEVAPHTPKPSMSQNGSNNKVENTTHEMNTNDTKSVWKQKDKETQAFRFTGEPVRRDEIKAFPFAGWPNRSKRTFRL